MKPTNTTTRKSRMLTADERKVMTMRLMGMPLHKIASIMKMSTRCISELDRNGLLAEWSLRHPFATSEQRTAFSRKIHDRGWRPYMIEPESGKMTIGRDDMLILFKHFKERKSFRTIAVELDFPRTAAIYCYQRAMWCVKQYRQQTARMCEGEGTRDRCHYEIPDEMRKYFHLRPDCSHSFAERDHF